MCGWIVGKISALIGYRFWFSVNIEYRDKGGVVIFNYNNEIGVVNKSLVLNRREVRKSVGNVSELKSVKKSLLRNGYITYYIRAYLGYLKIGKV